jgi:hypothetical protein
MNPPERPETVNRLVEEYLNNLTEEMKADLLSEVYSIKNDEKRIAEYRLDMRERQKVQEMLRFRIVKPSLSPQGLQYTCAYIAFCCI